MGTLTDVLQTGANDVYVVEQEWYITASCFRQSEHCIRDINMEQMAMTVYLMPGLRD